jgi:hydrogenase nickel incorporation protein HypB
MCATCGCSDQAGTRITDLAAGSHPHAHDHPHDDGPAAHDHDHPHDHDPHDHDHPHEHGPDAHSHGNGGQAGTRTISFEQQVLAKNDRIAGRNRRWLSAHGILAVNLMSSPGAGKTTLLERTIRDLGTQLPIAVIEGDQETLLDAERIRSTGCRVVQINTGAGCHLDADMLAGGLRTLDPPDGSLLLIENVGNLVCPALFDLGEHGKVVIMSVTEGADKPLKYPHMFRAAELMVLNKVDLLPYVDFDVQRCIGYARQVNPALATLEVSATRGDGLESWYGWLRDKLSQAAVPAEPGSF